MEEESVEESSRKKKQYTGYLKPTTFEVTKPNSKSIPVISDIKRKVIPKKSDVPVVYNSEVSTVYEGCKSPEMILASIISDEEIVEIGIMQYVYPAFVLHHSSGKFLHVKMEFTIL